MKTVGILLALSAVAVTVAATIEWNDLVATFSTSSQDPTRSNSFFQIPRTLDDAVSAGWVGVTGVNSNRVTVYCLPDDPRYCVLFDSYGYVAGVQDGLLVSDFEDSQSIYNMSRLNMFQKKTIFGIEVWTITAYTQDPAVIATGGRSSTWDNLTGTEGVWLETTDGYVKVPRNVEDLDSTWVKNACFPGMGTHYYIDMHSTTACEDVIPWFAIYREGTLTAVGLQGFGQGTIKNRSWYEKSSEAGVRAVIVTGPECLYNMADTLGFISIHTYFTAKPWEITCS